MKTVLSNRELPHKWAHQTQPVGRNGKGSFHFSGPSIYSYNAEIGRVIKRNGKTAYLVNDTSYSPTTSAHQSRMRRAIPDASLLLYIGNIGRCNMPDGPRLGSQVFDYCVTQAADALAKSTRARAQWKKDYLLKWHTDWLQRAKSASVFFGLRRKVDDRVVERQKERIVAEEKRQAKERREREAAREKEFQERIAAWLAGEAVQFPYSVQRVYLRRRPDTDPAEMQTSKGVTVPLADAERAFRFAMTYRQHGWHRNGEKFEVGEYQLDAINEQGIIAGCHRVDWEEVERFAKQQGWM